MAPISVRYHLAFGVIILLAAAFILGTGLFIGKVMLLGLGGLHLLLGFGIATQPIFVVHQDRLELKNLLGMTLKTHTYDSLAELEVRGRKLFRRGESKSLASALVARSADWQAVLSAVLAAR